MVSAPKSQLQLCCFSTSKLGVMDELKNSISLINKWMKEFKQCNNSIFQIKSFWRQCFRSPSPSAERSLLPVAILSASHHSADFQRGSPTFPVTPVILRAPALAQRIWLKPVSVSHFLSTVIDSQTSTWANPDPSKWAPPLFHMI